MSAVLTLGIVVVVLVLGASAAAVLMNRRAAAQGTTISGVAVARVTRVIAIIWAAANLIGMVNDAARKLFADTVNATLPVQQFWPTLPTAVQLDGAGAQVVSGGFTEAMVGITGLDTAARVWLTVGDVLQGGTNIVIGVVVALLCTSIVRQNPFRPALIRGINLTAITVLAGGLGWQICDAVAGSLASNQVLRLSGWSMNTAQLQWDDIHEVIGLPRVSYAWTVEFWPIWVALALFALAAAFRYGRRLQQDTEGLV